MSPNKIFSLYYHYLESSTTGLDDQRLFDLVRTTSNKLGIPCPKRLDVKPADGGKVFIERISCADSAVQKLYTAVSATRDDFARLEIENLQRVQLVTPQESIKTPELNSNSNTHMSQDQSSLSRATDWKFSKDPSGGYPHSGPLPDVPSQRTTALSEREGALKRQRDDEDAISSGNKRPRVTLDDTPQPTHGTDISETFGQGNLSATDIIEHSAHKIRDIASEKGTQQEQMAGLERENDELRARIRLLENQFKEEQRKRILSESIVENIRRETADPFVVPHLIDAFISISNVFSDINANEE